MLLEEGLISKELVGKMSSWKHRGFSVHSGSPVEAEDEDSRKTISEYISLEWIARITSHIPRKGAKQVIYYGAYSQAWRGRERRQGILPKVPAVEDSTSSQNSSSYSRHRRQQWAVLLKKVWDVDALKCPKCGGDMKVISFIEQPSVLKQILKHLDLMEEPERHRSCWRWSVNPMWITFHGKTTFRK